MQLEKAVEAAQTPRKSREIESSETGMTAQIFVHRRLWDKKDIWSRTLAE